MNNNGNPFSESVNVNVQKVLSKTVAFKYQAICCPLKKKKILYIYIYIYSFKILLQLS